MRGHPHNKCNVYNDLKLIGNEEGKVKKVVEKK